MFNKSIALIAHDGKKSEILDWSLTNKRALTSYNIFATGTTGRLIQNETGLKVTSFESGPLGGDIQIGALMVERKIDLLVFFWDPLEPQPHDPDVKALLRIAVLKNIPTACNKATADLFMSSRTANPSLRAPHLMQDLTFL
jgi:methylglyoxal synthase